MSLIRRKIDVTFQLGQGTFNGTQANAVKISGLRVKAAVNKAGGVGLNTLEATIYGLTQDLMNQFSLIGTMFTDGRAAAAVGSSANYITVEAGDDQTGMSTVFVGAINQAWANYSAMPDVGFAVSGVPYVSSAFTPIPPTSFPGSFDVGTAMAGLASRMNLLFQNDGVTTQLAGGYYPGNAPAQAQALAKAAGCQLLFDDIGGLPAMIIFPFGPARPTPVTILVSPETGMVGYPTCTQKGIIVRTLYNPQIFYGCKITVQSDIPVANGDWVVFNVAHDLESETPGGPWFTSLECSILGHPLPLPSGG